MNKQNFKIKTSSKYIKDLKNLSTQDKEALNIVIKKLITGDKLDPKYKDHSLSGELKGLRDCHIKSDLILIYKIDNNVLMLYLLRVGNHNNLQLSSLNKDNVYAQLKEARQQLVEMALSRKDAMDRCISLGEQFIHHFNKIYNSFDNKLKIHWTSEMNNWYKSVKKIILKNTNKPILTGDLRDWFYTAGSNYETIIENASQEEIEAYDNFTTDLINTGDVYKALKNRSLIENLKEAKQQTALKSNGIYSVMNDSWIKEPVAEDIPEINQEEFDKLFTEWEDKYFDIKENPTKESIENFIEDIYDLRKTSIANDGEYGLGNLIFKEMRSLDYLDDLRDIKKELINKELSLESLNKTNLTESLSQDEKEFFLNLIDELDIKGYLDFNLCNNSIAIKQDKITRFKKQYRDKIEDKYLDTFSSLLHPKTWENLSDLKFDGNKTFWDSLDISHITIPNDVTTIGDWAFANCKSLQSITIPNSVTSIGESAFYDCTSLQSIILEKSVNNEIVNQLNRQYPNIKIVLEENLNESILIKAAEKNHKLILDCVYGKAWEITKDSKSVASDSDYSYILIQTNKETYILTLKDKEIIAFSKPESYDVIYSFVILLIKDKNLYEICKNLNYKYSECNDDCFALAKDFFEKFDNNFKKSFELLNKIITYTQTNLLYEYDADIEHSTVLLFVRDPDILVDNLEAEAEQLDDDEAKGVLKLAQETEDFLLPDELVECSTLRKS